MNLDETWELCLKMWKWIAKNSKGYDVTGLKSQWIEDSEFCENPPVDNCFFCEYNKKRGGGIRDGEDCHLCPGKRVDKSFNCMERDICYDTYPDKFYKKLKELNKKRTKK